MRILELVKFNAHIFRIRDKIRGEIAFFKLHPFNDIQCSFDPFASETVMIPSWPTFSIASGDNFADLRIVVGRDSGDLVHFIACVDRLCQSRKAASQELLQLYRSLFLGSSG